MKVTYHLTTPAEWPPPTRRRRTCLRRTLEEGFVHCTDGIEEVAATANRYYSSAPELLLLTLDVSRLLSPVRYEDSAHIYPHVYGPIDREAIVDVQPMQRDESDAWMAPR